MESRPLDILARLALLLVLCGLSLPSYAQSPDSSDSDKSWTGSTDVNITNENATRINDSHAKSGNQTKDSHSVEALGPNGGYEPYLDTETETVKVNASTTRTIQRTYTRGPNGERALSQVTESESQSLPGGEVKVVRATSNPDINGDMQLVRREVADTKPTSPNAQETHTTVFVPSANGGLTAATQIIEHQTKVSDKSTTYQKSTLVSDGNGNWQTGETREGTITQDGEQRTTEEKVLRPDSEGNMSVISRTIHKEIENASGEQRETVEKYSPDIPGATPDGSLHLNQRITTVRQARPDGGEVTKQQVEQPNPGDPGAGLRVTVESVDTVRPGAGENQETRVVEGLDGAGDLGVVAVDMGKSDKPAQVEIAPAPTEKPK